MIGNDVVDLNLAWTSHRWYSQRFLDKIFSPAEQKFIVNSGDQYFKSIWRFWTMKESAYKVYIQQGFKPCFAPSRIYCHIESSNCGMVRIGDNVYRTYSDFTKDYVYSYSVSSNDITAITQCIRNDEYSHRSIHEQCRLRVLYEYASLTEYKMEDLKIGKCKKGIPRIFKENHMQNVSLSLSHHGHYYAFAMI